MQTCPRARTTASPARAGPWRRSSPASPRRARRWTARSPAGLPGRGRGRVPLLPWRFLGLERKRREKRRAVTTLEGTRAKTERGVSKTKGQRKVRRESNRERREREREKKKKSTSRPLFFPLSPSFLPPRPRPLSFSLSFSRQLAIFQSALGYIKKRRVSAPSPVVIIYCKEWFSWLFWLSPSAFVSLDIPSFFSSPPLSAFLSPSFPLSPPPHKIQKSSTKASEKTGDLSPCPRGTTTWRSARPRAPKKKTPRRRNRRRRCRRGRSRRPRGQRARGRCR